MDFLDADNADYADYTERDTIYMDYFDADYTDYTERNAIKSVFISVISVKIIFLIRLYQRNQRQKFFEKRIHSPSARV